MLSQTHKLLWALAATLVWAPAVLQAQEEHHHAGGVQLGVAHFAVSCKPAVQGPFDEAVARLHSFDYNGAEEAFKRVAETDPGCAMAWWGAAMTHFHQLWQPPLPPGELATAQQQIALAQKLIRDAKASPAEGVAKRERQFIAAAAEILQNDAAYATRLNDYEQSMATIAVAYPADVEAQMFYALALIAGASPTDQTHAKLKKAADILEPIYVKYPQHPGAAHYLIHAYDNAELAQRGLPMARAYSKIAPGVPHALHMPSHIFTRLGMWDDSIASNSAARAAANRAGDTGEELHAMDYLVYAYLQAGRDADAEHVLADLKTIHPLNVAAFKIGYAATAMPVRYLVERGDWNGASLVEEPGTAPPHVKAIAIWARGLGLARGDQHSAAADQIAALQRLEEQLTASGDSYWATQTNILEMEVMAWGAQAQGDSRRAVDLLRAAADKEDAIEKLPVTPGPIVPAREQLGQLLFANQQWNDSAREFRLSLVKAPGRRGAITGLAEATKRFQAQTSAE